MSGERRRYGQALDLVDSPELIAEYEAYHRQIWPEVAAHLREQGVAQMEIYRLGTRLFMMMEVDEDFDERRFAQQSLNHQVPTPWTPEGEKWTAMTKIFSLQDQSPE